MNHSDIFADDWPQETKSGMKSGEQNICDDNGIAMCVQYRYSQEKHFYAEAGNPNTRVDGSVYVEVDEIWLEVEGCRPLRVTNLFTPLEIEGVITPKITENI